MDRGVRVADVHGDTRYKSKVTGLDSVSHSDQFGIKFGPKLVLMDFVKGLQSQQNLRITGQLSDFSVMVDGRLVRNLGRSLVLRFFTAKNLEKNLTF